MKRNLFYFISFSFVLIGFLLFFQNSTEKKESDDLHQQQIKEKYHVFSLVQPQNIDFSGEKVDLFSSEMWERLDKEMLKNVYWQSNTILYIKRANKYFPIIEPILKANNIPDDFKYIAVIESGLENVVSPSGAAGFWQFLNTTATEYGLEVNSNVDERYHLEKSTMAACKYFRKAYQKFDNWTMVAASYNMGINGLQIASEKQKTNNFYNLYLNEETSRYIFRLLAVKEILEDYQHYGFVVRNEDLYKMPLYKEVAIDSTVQDLVHFSIQQKTNLKLLYLFNPWLRSSSLPNSSKKLYILKIPTDSTLFVSEEVDSIGTQQE